MVLGLGVFFAVARESERPRGWWLGLALFLALGVGVAGLGLVGGFLFFWALAAMGAVGWRAVRGAAAEEDRLMVIGLLAAAGVLLTDALFSLPFHIVPSAQLGVLLAGLLLSRWVRELPGGAGDRAAGGEG